MKGEVLGSPQGFATFAGLNIALTSVLYFPSAITENKSPCRFVSQFTGGRIS